jgi:hypothetical protein
MGVLKSNENIKTVCGLIILIKILLINLRTNGPNRSEPPEFANGNIAKPQVLTNGNMAADWQVAILLNPKCWQMATLLRVPSVGKWQHC